MEFYHSKNVNFVAWNYRGCSLSSGRPTIYNVKKDGLTVAEYVKARLGR